MNDLLNYYTETNQKGQVECLGMTFASEDARREYFLNLLAEKLKDPSFRSQDGFPHASDEAILALSDPPYYTVCPNPFVGDIIECGVTSSDALAPYSTEPFVADVSEGKNDPIYNAHSYHTKVPHKAIMRYILHYTQPGDLVFDAFGGTGMTGVAAELCGDRSTIETLGYRVDGQGNILAQEQEHGRTIWKPFSKVGARKAILSDLSPAATFIAYNYNTPLNSQQFHSSGEQVLAEVEAECGWMFETLHSDGKTKARINYTIWSDVFTCSECAGEVTFWHAAIDESAKQVNDEFPCPHCSANLTKRGLERAWTTQYDSALNEHIKQAKQVPVVINYSVGRKKFKKAPDAHDLDLIAKIEAMDLPYHFPADRLPDGFNTRQPMESHGITHVHHFYSKRNLWVVSSFVHRIQKVSGFAEQKRLMFSKTASERITTKLSSIAFSYYFHGGGGFVNAGRKGTLYVSSVVPEVPAYLSLKSRLSATGFSLARTRSAFITCQSSTNMQLPSDSVDYIFLDPPFGANINYSEMNFIWEAWLGVITNRAPEAIENRIQGKSLDDYRKLMALCFSEAFRVLKPGRWMTVEFSNTRAAVWNAIQTALQEAGFVVANVSALNKKQNSIQAYSTPTAVKQDLIISAYKPDGDLESRFTAAAGSESSVWDFVRTHLRYLPTVKAKNGQLEYVTERDPRIIFDRLVAWFVRHNYPVPLSSQEFQEGLRVRFDERDGMVFLPEQVTEYDRKRAQVAQAPQIELFVADERSAIDWLTDFLKGRPSTYQELHPEFISQLGAGWKKHEAKPELSALLEDNFLRYDGAADVPSQIHSYLSTNHKDLRGLEKTDLRLKAKAKDRWYVPDPTKAQDLERKRERSLLKEFEAYKSGSGRRLKEFRLEVLRAGFKTAWSAKDYKTIIGIAQKIPEEALQEDEKLLLWYDQALTRMEADA